MFNMKQTIKIKLLNGQKLPNIIKKGEWIDLRANSSVEFTKKDFFTVVKIPLGVAMKLPDGYEAIVAPRSSSFKNFGFIIANSFGVIDNSYCGNEDEWQLLATPLTKGEIVRGDRVCQFRIQLSQKATIWQKIKWLFTNKIVIEQVDDLHSMSRGGIGSTGTK